MGLFDGTALERPIICEVCGLDKKLCQCSPEDLAAAAPDVPPEKQALKVRVEKRKRGKLVTVVAGFRCKPEQMKSVLTQLKNHLGAGGTIEESNLELQGDHVERATKELLRMGYRMVGGKK